MNDERLEHLLDLYFDEALKAEEQAELERLLLSQPQARELFWKRARFHSLLRRRGRENWGRRLAMEQAAGGAPASVPVPRWRVLGETWRRALQPAGWWAAAGLAAMLLFFAWYRPGGKVPANPTANANADSAASNLPNLVAPSTGVPSSQGVATILRAVEVKWTGNKERPGNILGPGWLKFERGLVEVQFHRGARVVIEGPAEFELINDMQARCLLGKVRAEVPPPAIGFEILSPNVRVVDRGTAFGLDVKRDGPAEVHVFSGRVDLATTLPPGTPRELLQGKAVRVDATGAVSDIPSVSQEFTTPEVVERKATTEMALRFAAWRVQADRIRSDPALLVQYSFEDDSLAERRLNNHAPKAPVDSQGTIIGCTRTEGRWPGKQALEFKQVGDRIRLALPRQHEELTCITWVRLDAMDRPYTALLMSGDAVVGELQWQIRGDGQLSFGKRKEPGWGFGKLFGADSNPVLGPSRCGSWMQLAFVYDAHAKTVTHYLDGRRMSVNPMDARTPLITGALEIGNWTPAGGDPVEPIRAFNGRMDEFLVFSRALKAEEIQRHWEMGRPL
jgi:hypothetical protein